MWGRESAAASAGGDENSTVKKSYPQTAAGYELTEQIGKGTAATVFKAWCAQYNEEVAIKIVDLDLFQLPLEDIYKEIQLMSLSSHPNVVPYSTSFVVGQDLWVVMPLLTGGSVQSLLSCLYPEGMPEKLTQYLLFETLKALEYFHKHSQIHRNVKAANILLTSNGQAMLSDYGVMKWMVDGGVEREMRQTFVGTPCWMAPEVMEQRHGYNYKADLWSFGITAIELAQGLPPYVNYPPVKVMIMTLREKPPTLDEAASAKYSRAFKEMLEMCLQKDVSKRATATELLHHRFFRNVKKPDDLPASLAKLPPIGSRGGSQAKLYEQLRRVGEVGNPGPAASFVQLHGSLRWDFSNDEEVDSSKDPPQENPDQPSQRTTSSPQKTGVETVPSTNTLQPPLVSDMPPSTSIPPVNTPQPGAGVSALPSVVEEVIPELKAPEAIRLNEGVSAKEADQAPTEVNKKKSRFIVSEVGPPPTVENDSTASDVQKGPSQKSKSRFEVTEVSGDDVDNMSKPNPILQPPQAVAPETGVSVQPSPKLTATPQVPTAQVPTVAIAAQPTQAAKPPQVSKPVQPPKPPQATQQVAPTQSNPPTQASPTASPQVQADLPHVTKTQAGEAPASLNDGLQPSPSAPQLLQEGGNILANRLPRRQSRFSVKEIVTPEPNLPPLEPDTPSEPVATPVITPVAPPAPPLVPAPAATPVAAQGSAPVAAAGASPLIGTSDKDPRTTRKPTRFEVIAIPTDIKDLPSAREPIQPPKEKESREPEALAKKPSRFQVTSSADDVSRAGRTNLDGKETLVSPSLQVSNLKAVASTPSVATQAMTTKTAEKKVPVVVPAAAVPKVARKGRVEVVNHNPLNLLESLRTVMEQVELLMQENEALRKENAMLKEGR